MTQGSLSVHGDPSNDKDDVSMDPERADLVSESLDTTESALPYNRR